MKSILISVSIFGFQSKTQITGYNEKQWLFHYLIVAANERIHIFQILNRNQHWILITASISLYIPRINCEFSKIWHFLYFKDSCSRTCIDCVGMSFSRPKTPVSNVSMDCEVNFYVKWFATCSMLLVLLHMYTVALFLKFTNVFQGVFRWRCRCRLVRISVCVFSYPGH